MKWKFIVVFGAILCAVAVYCFVNISDNNKNVKYKDTYNEVNSSSVKYATMQEIRDSKDEVLKKIKNNEYKNLIYKDTNISIATCDSVSKLREYSLGLYKGITDQNEMLNMHLDIIYNELGENLDENYILDMYTVKHFDDGTNGCYTMSEIKELIKKGEYDDICECTVDGHALPALAYAAWSNVEGEYRYAHFDSDFHTSVVYKGKILEKGDHSEFLEYSHKPLAVYFPESDNLDDKYKLYGGEISIREAMEYVENYFKNGLPYDISMGAAKKIVKAEVYEIEEGVNVLEFYIVREMEGMVTEYGYPVGTVTDPSYTEDSSRALMIEIGDIDEYYLYHNTLQWEKISEEKKEVVSLESAVEQVAGKIGKNSVYELEEISMAYREKVIKEYIYQFEFECEPCWIVRCRNKNSNMNIFFYIDLFTGKLTYRNSTMQDIPLYNPSSAPGI